MPKMLKSCILLSPSTLAKTTGYLRILFEKKFNLKFNVVRKATLGSEAKDGLWLYTAFDRSIFLYWTAVWYEALQRIVFVMVKVQRSAIVKLV